MIAKILSSAAGFNGVNYNTNKIDNGNGELTLVANFGSLQGLSNLRPEDYKNYLKMISATNSRIKLPQFHAALSCKGQEYSKDELTSFAVDWMKKMGYGHQPFLVVFHSDTENNHVHLVSTRVDQETGKKINDSFEKLKAYEAIQSLLELDNPLKIDLEKVKEYNFSTEAQFKLLLEKLGYTIKSNPEDIEIIKYGRVQGNIEKKEIKVLSKEKDNKRIAQIKAIILKYQKLHNSKLNPDHNKLPGDKQGRLIGYSSQLSDFLKSKFGIDIVFHFSEEKKPYGYTLIDNASKNVFKGSEILALKELVKKSVVFNDNWFSAILDELKHSKLGVVELDAILNDNGFSRKNLMVLNKENNEVFELSKNDFNLLSINTKNSTSYKVLNEEEKKILSEILSVSSGQIVVEKNTSTLEGNKEMYSTLIMSAIHNYSSVREGLDSLNLSFIKNGDQLFFFDSGSNVFIPADQLIDKESENTIRALFQDNEGLQGICLENHFLENEFAEQNSGSFDLMISDDIDDEQIHGRNRRRKGQARTNTR